MRDAPRVVRAGLPPAAQGESFLPGLTFTGAYHAAGDPALSPYTYGRFHNPTWTHFEDALTELEGGPAAVFASGVSDRFIRLSAGSGDAEDILADLVQALDKSGQHDG